MNRVLTVVVLALLVVALTLLFTGPAAAKDGTARALAKGFSLDEDSAGHRLAPGSIIRQHGDGTTGVYKADNTLILTVKDDEVGMVFTPSGPVKASHVFNLPSGAEVAPKGGVTEVTQDGKLLLKVYGPEKLTAPQFSGWVEQASDWNIGNLDYFSATWKVPSNPPAPSSGTVDFLFNAIEPNSGRAIIQPVLEWNQAGSNAWTGRSWCGPLNGNYYASSPIAANTGNTIVGTLWYSWYFGWQISTRNLSTLRSTSIFTRLVGTSGLAVFCALEGYNISGNKDVPGTTTFSNMSFRYNYRNVTPAWKVYDSPPAGSGLTGLGVQIASPTQITLRTANP